MRHVLFACATIGILVLAATHATAQMCQNRGGSMARGMTAGSMNMHFYAPGYANYYPSNYYPNYYPGYYPTNYPNYYPNYNPNAVSAAASQSGNNGSRQGLTNSDEFDKVAKARCKIRASDLKSKAKADKLIAAGDEAFRKQKYAAAVQQYQSAARAAGDLAEPYLRQGFALVAQQRYVAAVKAFRRGLEIRHEWTDASLRLDQLYAEDALTKTNQALTKAVETRPGDPDRLVALGMQLFFDGQRDRAGMYFARAAGLGANRDRLLDDFLSNPALADSSKDRR
jgi:tetratricopeptide (TPR) repeat protein